MLNSMGRKTVLVGTIEYHVAGEVRPSPHTTPESRDLFELFAAGVEAGATEAVMEVSSHALKQGRVWGIGFDVAIFTNLTRDHLDYHRTMENYFAAKARLFDGSQAAAPRVAVINLGDPYGERLAETAQAAGAQVFGYGIEHGDFRAENLKMAPHGMSFTMQTPSGKIPIRSRLTGRVNVQNLLAAAAAALARGLTAEQIAEGAAALACVPGRFQTVDRGQPFTVVVDYAHTDDALRNLTTLAREFVSGTGGRVITLFGCGGDRDRAKRPMMGRAAGEGSDFVVLTSDNPRSEDPAVILEDILPGLKQTGVKFKTEPDRAQAIRLAMQSAAAGDIVLLAGKGHERCRFCRRELFHSMTRKLPRLLCRKWDSHPGRRLERPHDESQPGADRNMDRGLAPQRRKAAGRNRNWILHRHSHAGAGRFVFAISGERFDGHNFLDAAFQSGAVAAVVSHVRAQEFVSSARTIPCSWWRIRWLHSRLLPRSCAGIGADA